MEDQRFQDYILTPQLLTFKTLLILKKYFALRIVCLGDLPEDDHDSIKICRIYRTDEKVRQQHVKKNGTFNKNGKITLLSKLCEVTFDFSKIRGLPMKVHRFHFSPFDRSIVKTIRDNGKSFREFHIHKLK